MLGRYAAWLLSRRASGWEVVDVHGPLRRFLADRRQADPDFRLADDGVHLDEIGHWLMARELLGHWGLLEPGDADAKSIEEALGEVPNGLEVLGLVRRKQRVLKDAWLTETGHERPGMKEWLLLEEAKQEARVLDDRIGGLLPKAP